MPPEQEQIWQWMYNESCELSRLWWGRYMLSRMPWCNFWSHFRESISLAWKTNIQYSKCIEEFSQ